MVTLERTPMSPVDRDLAELVVQELRTLLVDRNLLEVLMVLQAVNASLAARQAEAEAEPMVH